MNTHGVPEPLELIARHAQQRPHAPAVTHVRVGKPPLSWSWSELLTHARAAAIEVDHRWPDAAVVPAYGGKSLSTTAVMLGTIASGRTFAGINPKFRATQVEQVLQSCDAVAAFTDSAGLTVVQDCHKAQPRPDVTWWWLDSDQAPPRVREVSELLANQGCLRPWAPVQDLPGVSPFAPPSGILDKHRSAVCLFTSGSTGVPKGVLVAWSDLVARAQAECELFELSNRDVLLSVLPFSFDVGLNQLASSWVSGAHLVMLDSWLPLDIMRAVERHAVTGVSGVPSIWTTLLQSPLRVDSDAGYGAWRYLTVSGGGMTASQLADLSDRVGHVGIFKTYGQTESFRSTALRPPELHQRPTSVGRPFASARVYIVNENGQRAQPGDVGEVVHTGLGTMLGYLNASQGDQKLRSNPFQNPEDPSPWAIFTGDQGYLDPQGYLHLVGRLDDLVKISGNRVHLSEIANQTCALPAVLAAEAVAVPQVDSDSVMVVFAVLRQPGIELTEPMLLASLRQRLPTYMHPKRLVLLEAFPLTASGKPDRPLLQRRAMHLLVGG
jgi:acyl-CoA synthetase (AMP-forming)/AMP-acid ligase II